MFAFPFMKRSESNETKRHFEKLYLWQTQIRQTPSVCAVCTVYTHWRRVMSWKIISFSNQTRRERERVWQPKCHIYYLIELIFHKFCLFKSENIRFHSDKLHFDDSSNPDDPVYDLWLKYYMYMYCCYSALLCSTMPHYNLRLLPSLPLLPIHTTCAGYINACVEQSLN